MHVTSCKMKNVNIRERSISNIGYSSPLLSLILERVDMVDGNRNLFKCWRKMNLESLCNMLGLYLTIYTHYLHII